MWGGAVSVTDGQLVSSRSGLLGALLPSRPFWFLLSVLVPSWSSSWVSIAAFFWRSCSSRSWFCLVRRSTAVRVWTCLFRAVGRGLSPWLLMVVAIEWVSTMQLFVRDAIIWLTKLRTFPQTAPTDEVEKSPMSHTTFARSKQYLRNKKRRLSREHQYGAGQILFKGQVRTSHNFRVPKLGWIMLTFFLRVFKFL